MPAASTPQLGKRERAKAQNRHDILKAARDVFAEMGYGAASIRDIIRRTPLAAGTFYNYFPDKESIFRVLLEESTRDLRQRVHSARERAETIEEFVGGAYRAYFEFVVGDRVTFELMRRNDGAIRALLGEPAMAAAAEELLEDLQVAVQRGTIPAFDVEYLAAAMYGVAFELAVRMVDREPVDVDGATRFATDLFLGGIARLAEQGRRAGGTRRMARAVRGGGNG